MALKNPAVRNRILFLRSLRLIYYIYYWCFPNQDPAFGSSQMLASYRASRYCPVLLFLESVINIFRKSINLQSGEGFLKQDIMVGSMNGEVIRVCRAKHSICSSMCTCMFRHCSERSILPEVDPGVDKMLLQAIADL